MTTGTRDETKGNAQTMRDTDDYPSKFDARERADVLIAKLTTLGIPCELERVVEGPQVIRYELRPTSGVLMREILRTADDLSFATGAYPTRILAPLPGRADLIGVELPCAERRIVRLSELPAPIEPLSFPLGPGVDGEPIFCDLARSPHLAIAGQTGGGKSSCIHAMVGSLISRFGPDELTMLMIDTKQVELPPRYSGLPHLLLEIADDVDSATELLEGTLRFVNLRFAAMQQYGGGRDIDEMNVKLRADGRVPWPRCILIIDEVADLMMASRKVVESLIVRIAQKSRAVGIHLVVATQSPRVSVLTGLLKANLPSRICFSVASQTDSRVVMDRNGGELLLGCGDGLFSMAGAPPVRFQGIFVDSDEIQAICDRWRAEA
jgi:S-DNA-T family DNA segregation ATPase FtsK/SpoIIIE